ncbi:MAG: hypothetical protein RR645_07625 [Clostridium sp.]
MLTFQITIMFALLFFGIYLAYKSWVAELNKFSHINKINRVLYRAKYDFIVPQVLVLGLISYMLGIEVVEKLQLLNGQSLFTYQRTMVMLPMYLIMLLWLTLVIKYLVGLRYPTIIHDGGIIFRSGNIVEFGDIVRISYMKALIGRGYNVCVSTRSGGNLIIKVPDDEINRVLGILRDNTSVSIYQQ